MKTFKEAFVAKYPKYGKLVMDFAKANDLNEVEWQDMTKVNLANFVDYLTENVAPSSAKTYCAMLKAVLSLYSDEVALPKDFAKVLSLRGCPSQNTWLTDDEIYKLIAYNPESPTEHLVRNQFVLEAVTGARHSDVIKFTRKNIVDDTLVYVSRKTHIKASIPLAPVVVRFLKEIDFISREVSTVTFNLILREICRKNGITEQVKLYRHGVDCEGEKWQFISSHSGRRSFASNLYLRGADLLAISKLMGHTDVKMTQGYIVCPPRLNDEILNYFKQFD